MYLEYTRNNAVLRTFVQLLSEQTKRRRNEGGGGRGVATEDTLTIQSDKLELSAGEQISN